MTISGTLEGDIKIKVWQTGLYTPPDDSKHPPIPSRTIRQLHILIERDGEDPQHEQFVVYGKSNQ